MDFRPGDWLCSCSAHNYASKAACFKCRMPREAVTGQPQLGQYQPPQSQQPTYQSQPQPPPLYPPQPSTYGSYPSVTGLSGTYGASTGYSQEQEFDYYAQQQQQLQQQQQQQLRGFGDNTQFDSFRANMPVSQAALQQVLAGLDTSSLFASALAATTNPLPANFRPGDWLCTCGNHNYAVRTACGKCGKVKNGTVGGSNLPGNFRPGDWMCKCGNHNYQSRSVCGKCNSPKEQAKQPVTPQMAPNFQVGDWMCVCGAHNYQSKSICYKCSSSKDSSQASEPSSSLSSGPPPLPPPTNSSFRPGDWLCESCQNHNYASRIVCGRCKTPKASEGQRDRSPTTGARERSRSPKR